jgi:hypothetical protein
MPHFEYLIERLAAQEEARRQAAWDWQWLMLLDEPPTHEPTRAECIAYAADEAVASLTNWQTTRLMGADYDALVRRAFEALYTGDAARAKRLGCAVEAARDALRAIAADDVRTLGQVAERAVVDALRGEVTERLELEGV